MKLIEQWPAPGRLLSVGKHNLHLHCKGQGGPTLVLEAGMAGWSQDWAFVSDGLAQAGQVCTYDRAGYGWSDVPDSPRNGMDAVNDLRRALHSAGIAPPYLLIGHSFGGLLAAMHARAYPNDVAGLALIDAVGRDYESQFRPERYRKFRSSLRPMISSCSCLEVHWPPDLPTTQCTEYRCNKPWGGSPNSPTRISCFSTWPRGRPSSRSS